MPGIDTYTVNASDAGVQGTPLGLLLTLTYNANSILPFDRLWVGVTGNVAILSKKGTSNTFTNVPVGMLELGGLRVLGTGTTATGLIAIIDNGNKV